MTATMRPAMDAAKVMIARASMRTAFWAESYGNRIGWI